MFQLRNINPSHKDFETVYPTEYIHKDWQWPLSGEHSIMMVKSAQPGEGGVARPPPFTLSTITCKVLVYAPAERADTLHISPLRLYVLCGLSIGSGGRDKGRK